jgi:hypothetical protein
VTSQSPPVRFRPPSWSPLYAQECLLLADTVEKVENTGLPKSQPIRDLSECCRSMLCHFRYAAHALLERRIGRSPNSIVCVGPYGLYSQHLSLSDIRSAFM